MRICVVGAGAIGGLLAARLALSGHKVCVIARGAHLAAIQERGMILYQDGERLGVSFPASQRFDELGIQDLVILALKAHQIEEVVHQLPQLMTSDTVLLTLQNGIPWWYFQKSGTDYDGRTVRTVDPDGTLAGTIDPDRIVGCVAYPAATIAEPGVVEHVEGIRFPIGELDCASSERAEAISAALVGAGFKAPVLADIRSEIWLKLWGNLAFNPISALTHATLVDICRFPMARELAAGMMGEAQLIGEKLGATFRVSLDKRIAGAESVGKHKTSMLQDVEAGKPLEIAGVIGAVVELGELTATPTPTLKAIHACVSLLSTIIEKEGVHIRAEAR